MTPSPDSENFVQFPTMDEEQPTHSSVIDGPSSRDETDEPGTKISPRLLELDLYKETDRLKTFENWPVTFIDKRDVAAAGFYFTNNGDKVKCPYCQIEVGHWVDGDDPMADHRKHSPNCKFVQREVSNFDIPPDINPLIGEDACGPRDSGRTNTSVLSVEEEYEWNAVSDKLKINVSERPLYPQFNKYEDRLKTFEQWPYPNKIAPDILSLAGFVYTRSGDGTFCFHCGGSLRNWDDFDEPWIEHAHWFPECKYVLKTRGQKFIDDARVKRHENLVQTQQEIVNVIETIKELLPQTEDLNTSKTSKESSTKGNNTSSESVICQRANKSASRNDGLATCLICLDAKRDYVLLPCYHVVGCEKCVKKLKYCCVCREKIIISRKLFFS